MVETIIKLILLINFQYETTDIHYYKFVKTSYGNCFEEISKSTFTEIAEDGAVIDTQKVYVKPIKQTKL
jgi:citrate lyase synthetase